MEEYIDLCEKVIEKTIPKVDYVDIRAGKSNNSSIIMKDGSVDEVNTEIMVHGVLHTQTIILNWKKLQKHQLH